MWSQGLRSPSDSISFLEERCRRMSHTDVLVLLRHRFMYDVGGNSACDFNRAVCTQQTLCRIQVYRICSVVCCERKRLLK